MNHLRIVLKLIVFALIAPMACAAPVAQPANTSTPSPTAADTPTPSPTPGLDVVLYRNDAQRSGAYTASEVRDLPEAIWQVDGDPGAAPVLANEVLYQTTFNESARQGYLYARDPTTGEALWTFGPVREVYVGPAVADGLVYIGTNADGAYAINAETGAKVWHWPSREYISAAPLVAEDMLYITTANGALFALDAQTGEEKWMYAGSGDASLTTAYNATRVYYAPGNRIVALDAQSGAALWEQSTGQQWMMLALNDGTLYAGNIDGTFHALDAASGESRWTFAIEIQSDAQHGDFLTWSSPAIAAGVVYVGASDQHLYALDAASGEVVWTIEAEDGVGDPSVVGDVVYFGTAHHEPCFDARHVVAVDATTGQKLWKFLTSSCIWGEIVPAADQLFVVTRDGVLSMLK